MADGTRLSLQMLAMVDVVMLSLPLFVLASIHPESSADHIIEVCGWSSSTLHTTCIAAICSLCFSIFLTGTQLILLGATNAEQSTAFAQRLLRHLPLPIVATAIGGLIGAVALWGHAVIQHGECNPEVMILLASAFALTYLIASMYVYMSPVVRSTMYISSTSVSLLQVIPDPCISEPVQISGKNEETNIFESVVPHEGSQPDGNNLHTNTEPQELFSTELHESSIMNGSHHGSEKKNRTTASLKRTSSVDSCLSSHSKTSRRGATLKRTSSMDSCLSSQSKSAKKGPALRRTSSMESCISSGGSKKKKTGLNGKSVSPENELETSKGTSKPDRLEGLFSERRLSLTKDAEAEVTDKGQPHVDPVSAEPPQHRKASLKSAIARDSDARNPTGGRKSVSIMETVTTQVLPKSAISESPESPQISPSPSGISGESPSGISPSPSTAPVGGRRERPKLRKGLSSMLDLDVAHYSSCPINFNTFVGDAADDTSSEGDAEIEPQVEVPLWLMDQTAQKKLASTDIDEAHESERSKETTEESEEWSGDDADSEDKVAPLPDFNPEPATEPAAEKRRISFLDQVKGTPFPQYSKDKKQKEQNVPKKKPDKSVHMAVRSGSAPAQLYWKVPRPTRRGTAMPAPIVRNALNKVPDVAEELEEIEVPEKSFKKETRRSFKQPPPSIPLAKRPSVLSVFSEGCMRKEGHYALPPVNEQKGPKADEIVEVRRQSLIMSKSMMTDLIKQKLNRDEYNDRDIEPFVEGDDEEQEEEEIILPFFVAGIENLRKCNCKVDPLTGNVIHTCMTPNGTACENTQNYASFVCSAWGTKAATRISTTAASRRTSRLGSGDSLVDPGSMEQKRPEKGDNTRSRRIRNASMLEVVGRAAPSPGKQNTDKGGHDEKVNSDSEEDKPEENELNVSYSSLRRVSMGQMELEITSGGSSAERGAVHEDDTCRRPLDMQVESELGHRFQLVQPWELAQWLNDPQKREDLLVVDARGRDWVGAHIPSSINVRTSEICSHPEALTQQCLRNRIDHIVFTCMYSVLRARKSAIAIERFQDEALRAGLQPYRIKISLLAGGMHGWVNYFVSKGECVEQPNPYIQDFDPSCWCDGGPSQGGLVHVMDALWSEGGQQALNDALVAELNNLAALSGSLNASRRESMDPDANLN